VFERDSGGPGNWGQAAKLVASDGAFSDWFGVSVSISGDAVVVGALGDDDNGDSSGSAYVFERDEGGPGNWGQVAKLTASDGAEGDYFGASVSIYGDAIVAGASCDDADSGERSGSAYLFERDEGGPGTWGQVAKLTASDGASYDYFGYAVSIGGDTVVIGAWGDADNGDDSGSVYLFERNEGGPNSWGQVAKLIASDGAQEDEFGNSVSISGDTVVVGAYFDDDNGFNSGSAYVFERDEGGADNWGQVAKLTASDGAQEDEFGTAVSISGDTVVVGASWDDDNGDYSGSVYLFERDEGGPGNWGQVTKLSASDGDAGDRFGSSVASGGELMVVGAWGDDDNGDNSGSAYVFIEFEPVAWVYLPVVLRGAP
jgi:hypothetical protein